MNINEVRQWVDFVANKTQSGVIKTSQFNLAAQNSQLEFFNKQFRIFQTTKEVTDALRVWLTPVPLSPSPTTGMCNYPDDYMRFNAVYRQYFEDNEAKLYEVTEVNNDEIGNMMMSQIIQPTLKYPRVSRYDTYMQFYPKKIGAIQLNYFRRPANPVWGFTVVSGRQVYDPTTSVDLEVLPEFDNEICMMILSYIGINLREDQLIQFAEMLKKQRV